MTHSEALAAFFRRDGDQLVPRPHARSPWTADMMHGRLLAGLAAWAIETEHLDEPFHLTRLTTDLFKAPPMEPVLVTTEVVRDGRRIRTVDARMTCGGALVARSSAVLLRKGPQPTAEVWSVPEWTAPPPEAIPAQELRPEARVVPIDVRALPGAGFGGPGRKQVWVRELCDLVDGVPLTPLVRLAAAADLANPLANSAVEGGLDFINADITMYARRLPRGEWVGFDTAGHVSADGVAVGQCALYDVDGALGWSTVCAVVNPRLGMAQAPETR